MYGIGEMTLRYGERLYTQEVVVAELGKDRAILGIDFILKNKVKHNFPEGYMETACTRIILRKHSVG